MRVAQHLETHIEALVRRWVDAVVSDTEIPSSDRMTFSALQDHFPEMLRELAVTIRVGVQEVREGEIKTTGAAHGKMRWKNGYRLDEVLRELDRARQIIIGEIRGLFAENEAVDVDPITHEVERFFSLVAATSAIQFSAAQGAEILLRNRQLHHAYEQVQAATDEVRDISESRLSLLRAVTPELRNAVQPLVLAATFLKESTIWDTEAEQSLKVSATRLQSLLSTLADLSTLLAGDLGVEIEKFGLFELLDYIESKHRSAAESKGLRFESQLERDMTDVYSDLSKVKAIADELVQNALKFTELGFIRVEIAESAADRWVLRVADSGRGFEPRVARQVFGELHGPPESQNAGARLGLVTSRYLARLLGGELTFITSPLKGSTFQLNLLRDLHAPKHSDSRDP